MWVYMILLVKKKKNKKQPSLNNNNPSPQKNKQKIKLVNICNFYAQDSKNYLLLAVWIGFRIVIVEKNCQMSISLEIVNFLSSLWFFHFEYLWVLE